MSITVPSESFIENVADHLSVPTWLNVRLVTLTVAVAGLAAFVLAPASTVSLRSDSLPNDVTTLAVIRAGTMSKSLDPVTSKPAAATSFPESTHSTLVNATWSTLAFAIISPIFSYPIADVLIASFNSWFSSATNRPVRSSKVIIVLTPS